jgi:hypothetical protein
MVEQTRLERCTLWSTIKFQRCSLHHNTGHDISRATKEIKNSRMVSKATMAFKADAATM